VLNDVMNFVGLHFMAGVWYACLTQNTLNHLYSELIFKVTLYNTHTSCSHQCASVYQAV